MPRRRSAQGRHRAPQALFLPRTCLSPPRKQPGGHGGAIPSPAAGKRHQYSPGEPGSRSGPLSAARSLPPPRQGRGFPCPAAAPAPSPGRTAWQRPRRHVAPRRPLPPRPRRPPAPLPGTARHIPPPASPHLGQRWRSCCQGPAAVDSLAPSRLPLLLRAGRGARSRAGAPDRLRRSGAGGTSEAPRLTKLRHGRRAPIYSAAASLWQRTSSNQPRSAGTGRAPTAAIVTYGRTCARRRAPLSRPARPGPCAAPAPSSAPVRPLPSPCAGCVPLRPLPPCGRLGRDPPAG